MKHIVCLEISLKESVHPRRTAEMSSKATASMKLIKRLFSPLQTRLRLKYLLTGAVRRLTFARHEKKEPFKTAC